MIETSLDVPIYNSVLETERHLHNCEKWFGAASAAVGETHVADRMNGAILPFTLIAGNNDFGAWVQILGSTDTPVAVGMTKFDPHRFMVTETNSTNPFIIQVAGGESSELAAILTSEAYTEAPYIASSNNNDSGISDILARRSDVGVKGWARCACVGGNGSILSLYFGIHEYPK